MTLGQKIRRGIAKALVKALSLSPPDSGRWVTIFDSFTGAWQMDVSQDQQSVLRYSAVFACIRTIAGDIAKLPIDLIRAADPDKQVWQRTENPAYSPVLRKPNHFQTRLEFLQFWLCSLLLEGNTYVLKGRDASQKVRRLTVIDPTIVTPLVALETGDVFYKFQAPYALAGIDEKEIVVPASEVIHHKYIALNHPLVGNSPLQVAGAAATAGQKINSFAQKFFSNHARPAGVLETPKGISQEQAALIKEAWQQFSLPENQGKIAILEGGLSYKALAINAVDAQMLETLKYTKEDVCIAFGVPAWKIGAAPVPTASNVEATERMYYSQTLQVLIEGIELLLDDGFQLPNDLGIQLDLRALLRMDTERRYKSHSEGVKGGWLHPNAPRIEEGYLPVAGGDTPYMQQQNFSLAALSKRDAQADPFATSKPAAPTDAAPADESEELPADLQEQVDEGELTEDEAREQVEARGAVFYAGVYQSDEAYDQGAFVTHKGSLWYCKHHTLGAEDAKPGTSEGATYWTLAVKAGKAERLTTE